MKAHTQQQTYGDDYAILIYTYSIRWLTAKHRVAFSSNNARGVLNGRADANYKANKQEAFPLLVAQTCLWLFCLSPPEG